ncbi:MAG: ubiquinone biosynthesis regulatory protein kinase UbiB [Gammaproteobacteria bacterium]|nr:ubiquinone biosynthesis regulatory protein kinase UbiB [Gammaproteobacteria bacterium]MDH3856358.1 ubiquinone biosynthesis regulatory protein kinase UbiB [Gammaproteobacteria bacterium]
MRNLSRLISINFTLARFGLDEIVLSMHFYRPLYWLGKINPFNWFRGNDRSEAVRLRLCIESLGPIFIKFGQMMSTRRDLFGDEIADELEKLLDQVPPFPWHQARDIIEQQLGMPLERAFGKFDEREIASASIAQVYGAQLPDGQDVVVKIVRPGIEQKIRQDIEVLMLLAKMADRYWQQARRVKPIQIVREFETTIFNELDLVREAANASELRRNFEDSPDLYVPSVHWDYCRSRVMVMERISGIPISDIKQLQKHDINLEVLSRKGVEIFFTQVFDHNYFHADMHPGNIFVAASNPQNPRYIAVDFGIMGSLSTSDQRYLAENFVAFFNRDYRRVAELHVDSGWVDHGTRIDEFEATIRSVCEPMFQRPLAEISFGQLLLRLFQTARAFNMEIQPQLLLLEKTFLHIEGIGRQLYPQLDLWDTAKPFIERWLSEQLGTGALIKGMKKNLPYIAEHLPDLPQLAFKALDRIANDELRVELRSQQIDALKHEIRRANRRSIRAVIGGSFVISASIIMGLDGIAPIMVGSGQIIMPLLSAALAIPGIYLLISSYLDD